MKRLSDRGFTVIEVLIILVLIVVIVGVGFYAYRANRQTENNDQPSQSQKVEQTTEQVKDTISYQNAELGITFEYPKEWKLVDCNDEYKAIYLASDDRGVGINDDGQSILCGGGTDFPPQVSIMVKPENDYQGDTQPTAVTIAGYPASKYVDVLDGSGLYPAGFEWVTYYIDRGSDVLEIRYAKWPADEAHYDTSEESKQLFTELVEKSLRFL